MTEKYPLRSGICGRFPGRRLFVAGLVAAVAACAVEIKPPDKPIVLQVDLNIKHEIELKVARDLEQASTAPRVPLAKKAGWIGERANGYLGTVRDAPADIKALVLEVNEERQVRYRQIAGKHKVDVSTVEKLAGQRLIEKSAAGEFISLDNATWKKK